MTNRMKYYISIVFFTLAVFYMLYIQGQVISAGMSGALGAGEIVQMFISFAVLIAAIFMFVYFRGRKDRADVSQEELLTRATKQSDVPDQKPKP